MRLNPQNRGFIRNQVLRVSCVEKASLPSLCVADEQFRLTQFEQDLMRVRYPVLVFDLNPEVTANNERIGCQNGKQQ
jgi:hypothetical protein